MGRHLSTPAHTLGGAVLHLGSLCARSLAVGEWTPKRGALTLQTSSSLSPPGPQIPLTNDEVINSTIQLVKNANASWDRKLIRTVTVRDQEQILAMFWGGVYDRVGKRRRVQGKEVSEGTDKWGMAREERVQKGQWAHCRQSLQGKHISFHLQCRHVKQRAEHLIHLSS